MKRALTPSDAEIAHASRIVEAFAAARAQGRTRVEVAGAMVEKPYFDAAERLLARAKALAELEQRR